jgi:HK97 family phage major capsid protein
MEEGDLSQGGYNVPTEFGEHIYAGSLEGAIVRPRAQFQPMRSNRIEISADVDASHASTFFGGVTIYRGSEGGQLSASNPTYEKIGLQLHKVTGLCHVTDELLEDSAIAIEADLTRKFSAAIAFVQDDDFLNGTGANQPLGALNSKNPAIITVTAVSGQGASTVIAENIRDMYARMYALGKRRGIWLANDDVYPQLFGLNLASGTAGIPLWMPAGGVSAAPYDTLMGRPLIFTEKCQTLGTAGDIAFVDLSAYIVAGKANSEAPAIASSMHFKFDYGMQSFRFTLRYDGQPLWRSALTPKYSSTTLSPFIVLSGTRT